MNEDAHEESRKEESYLDGCLRSEKMNAREGRRNDFFTNMERDGQTAREGTVCVCVGGGTARQRVARIVGRGREAVERQERSHGRVHIVMKMQPQFGVQIQERRSRSDEENETRTAIERGMAEVHQRERKRRVRGNSMGKAVMERQECSHGRVPMWMKMQPQFGVQIQECRGSSDGENETEPAIERGTREAH